MYTPPIYQNEIFKKNFKIPWLGHIIVIFKNLKYIKIKNINILYAYAKQQAYRVNKSLCIYRVIAVKRDIQIVPTTLQLARVPYK